MEESPRGKARGERKKGCFNKEGLPSQQQMGNGRLKGVAKNRDNLLRGNKEPVWAGVKFGDAA